MRAWAAPTRAAMRGWSWLPSTQFGQPPLGQGLLVILHEVGDRIRPPRGLDQLEVEGQVGAREVRAVIGDQTLDREIDLADQHAFAISAQHRAHPGDDVEHLRPVGGVDLGEAVDLRRAGRVVRVGGDCRGTPSSLDQVPDHVDAKTVDAALQHAVGQPGQLPREASA